MSAIDYWAIRTAIRTVLKRDENLDNVYIHIEEEFIFGVESTPAVIIYLDGREAPDDMQSISAGKKTRYLLTFSLWCYEYNMESVALAIKARDTLIGNVEIALLRDHSLESTVTKSWLEGGGMFSARTEEGQFFASAEVILVADVTASL